MNTKVFLLFLLFFIGACTTKPASPQNAETERWEQTLTQLDRLLKEKKTQGIIDLVRQRLPELLHTAEKNDQEDTLTHYLHKLISICHYAYTNSTQSKSGIAYFDSLSQNPYLQKYCQYELLGARAGLRQINGENREAIRLADEYLKLPRNPNAHRFIREAEIISGVYVYSGNDFQKAIHILEEAVKAYQEGGRFENMLQLISRLGIYYRITGKYEKAVATNQKAISSYNDSLPPGNVVIAYGEQANLYGELGLYDRALQMNEKAQHYSMLKDSFGLGDLYRYRAIIFRQTGEKDSIFHYLHLGEKVSALKGSYKGVFVNKVLMADVYMDYPDSVQKALQLTLSLCPDSTRVPPWAKSQLNLQLGRALLLTGQEQKGIQLIEQASQSLADMNMMEGHTATRILMDHYLKKGMNDAFARCYVRNQSFADSLENIKKIRAVAAANIRFDAREKEKENKLLSTQVKLQKQQLLYNICISIALLLLLIISAAYFIARRKSQRQLIESNKREIQKLITHQQDLNRRNEQLTEQIEQAMATNNITTIRQLTGQNLLSKEDENAFRQSFAALYPSYLPNLREHYPQLTRNEELLAMLICMNQSTDEIALIMGINRSSVNVVRSRMRKNMELPKEQSLDDVLKQYLS